MTEKSPYPLHCALLPKEEQTPTKDLNSLLNYFAVQQDFAQFVREKGACRAAFSRGSGAYGRFTAITDFSEFTKAHLFGEAGRCCRIFVRFSALNNENADTERDLRGFAVRFFTDEGKWDLIGSNSPVFYLKNPAKFSGLLRAQRRSAETNLKSATDLWDFYSKNPETLHHLLLQMSARGLPKSFTKMHGYGTNTFSLLNGEGERIWVKFHLKTQQGIENFAAEEAKRTAGEDPDFAHRELRAALQNGDKPTWKLYVQTMTEEQAEISRWDPFDPTKVWLHADFPLTELGQIELTELPAHYSEVEQMAFSPFQMVPGIGSSPDPILQSRFLTYPDAQRARLGDNCPATKAFSEETVSTDSSSAFQLQNSARKPTEDDDDHYTQPGLFYAKVLNEEERKSLVATIVADMTNISGPARLEIINKQLCHFFRANVELGLQIATGLNINIDANMMAHF